MAQKEDESSKDFIEHFQYNLQGSKHSSLEKDALKTILLRPMRDDCLDMLNTMGKGDISKALYDDIILFCLIYLRGASMNGARE